MEEMAMQGNRDGAGRRVPGDGGTPGGVPVVELNDVEKLAVAQAFMNAVGKLTETKNVGNLRGRVDGMMKERFYEDPMAGKSYDVRLLGQKVGTYSLTVSKPKPSSERVEFEVKDPHALFDWAIREGCVNVDMEAVMQRFKETAEVPDGCSPITVVVPSEPGGVVTRTTLKVDEAAVAERLGGMLGAAARMLLEGGTDD